MPGTSAGSVAATLACSGLGKISSGNSRIHSLNKEAMMLASYSSGSSRRLTSRSTHDQYATCATTANDKKLTNVEPFPPPSDVDETAGNPVQAFLLAFTVQIALEKKISKNSLQDPCVVVLTRYSAMVARASRTQSYPCSGHTIWRCESPSFAAQEAVSICGGHTPRRARRQPCRYCWYSWSIY